MKFILKLLIFYFLFVNILFANYDFYETSFHKIVITDKDFTQSKIKKIEEIKKISLQNILYKILTDNNYKKLNRLIDINYEKNFLIKNILIENEFISLNKYSADIKVIYDKDEIIKMLRKYKINYTDFKSSNFLLIAGEKNYIYNIGLSHNNNFYNDNNINTYGLLNLIYPNLSLNDRYILPYNKIINKDLNSFINIASKYNVDSIFLIILENNNDNLSLKLNLFSILDKKFYEIEDVQVKSNEDFHKIIFDFLNNWWKEINTINNKKISKKNCYIKNANIYELNYINDSIKSISQVKSNELLTINLGFNQNEIVYYGDFSILSHKLNEYKIKIKIENNTECIISSIN
ncbi:MAG: hypothetical protein ACJ0RE_00895 [Alphaproteobacteria bacterium]